MAFLSSLGDTAVSLIIKIGYGLIAVIILCVLFFGTRYFAKMYKKRKNFKIQAVIFNPDGTFYLKQIGKFLTEDKIDKMLFLGSTETMPVINPAHIRNGQVVLWRYGVGQYAVVPYTMWGRNPKDFKIEMIDYQMKNFAYLEQRAAVSRWAYIKDLIQKYAPYITAVLILILAGVAIWMILKTALGMFSEAVAQRTADCMKLIGQTVTPS